MRYIITLFVLLSALAFGRNDVPSCYDALKIQHDSKPAEKELFVLVDQTTVLDKKIMMYAYKNMIRFIKNGYKVTIASFSSNANGKYTDVAYSGALERLLEEGNKKNIPKSKLRKYEGCMNAQHAYAKKKATRALVGVLKGASKELPHSDIMKSLNDIAKNLITPSKAKEKIVLLISDMMEHSSITSFYSNGGLKNLNIDKEMNKLKKSGFKANFGGAKIYVVGTGMVGKKSYRDSKSLKNLVSFWEKYFSDSNGNLVAIGTPMLLGDVE